MKGAEAEGAPCCDDARARGHKRCGTCKAWFVPTYNAKRTDLGLERFLEKFVPGVGSKCWLWQATLHPAGHGMFSAGRGRNVYAHRWSYEYFVGPIPDGLEIDHLCRVRNCVNPLHLEPVTHAVNMERARGKRKPRTHCAKGHEYTPENTLPRKPDAPWQIRCRECQLEANRIYHAKNRDEVNARAAARREANPEPARAASREYQRAKRARDPEAARLYQVAWREKNREDYNAKAREYQRKRRMAKADT